jgi:hypothetical protein
VTNFGISKIQNGGYKGNRRSAIEEQKTLREEDEPVTSIVMSIEVEVGSMIKSIAEASANKIEGKSLVELQVNWRTLEFRCCYRQLIMS